MNDLQTDSGICPYCKESISVNLPENYAPEYRRCGECNKKIIVERLAKGFQILKLEGAPCSSDPDCRALEMGSSDEQ